MSTSTTSFLGLYLSGSVSGSSQSELTTRNEQFGESGSSNMQKIDTWASGASGSISALSVGSVPAGYCTLVSGNYYTVTMSNVTSYTNLVCMLQFNATNTGSASININSLGAKSLYKSKNGIQYYMTPNDLIINEYYLFAYDGNALIKMSSEASAFQPYVISASSGSPTTSDLSNAQVLTAGSGITIISNVSASTITINATGSITGVATTAGSNIWTGTNQFNANVGLSIRTVTSTGSITNADNKVNCDATSAGIILYLPSAATKQEYWIKKIDSTANTVTVSGSAAGQTIDGALSITLSTQYAGKMVYSDPTNLKWWVQ
jgi:hypothetical protein